MKARIVGGLAGLIVVASCGASFMAGKATGGLMVVVADCDPSPPIKGRKTMRV